MPQVAYGLRLESDGPIDGLPAACGDEIAAVRIQEEPELRVAAHARPDAALDLHGHPLLLYVNGDLEMRWGERAYYRLGVGDARIRCAYGPAGSFLDMQQWLLHYALPLYVVIGRHLEFLHGGAVQIGDTAVAFLAPSGIGKSTLVEHFVQRGHGLVTDDKLGIVRREGRYFAVPSTPYLYADETKMHRKRAHNYARGLVPLSALYVLAPAAADVSPAVAPLDPARAAFELGSRSEVRLPETVRARLGLPRYGLDGFAWYCELAAHVRVSRLSVPRALARLADVYDTVVADAGGNR